MKRTIDILFFYAALFYLKEHFNVLYFADRVIEHARDQNVENVEADERNKRFNKDVEAAEMTNRFKHDRDLQFNPKTFELNASDYTGGRLRKRRKSNRRKSNRRNRRKSRRRNI